MKKSFLVLLSATLMLFGSGCEKTPSVETFDTFVEEAIEGCVTLRMEKQYIGGKLYWSQSSGNVEGGVQSFLLLFYSDGTCRRCYRVIPGTNGLDHICFYNTLHWEADAEQRVIRFTDKELQEKGSAFAVTELKLTSRSGDRLTFKGMTPSSLDLILYHSIAEQEVYRIYSGTLSGTAEREKAETLYRNEADYPQLEK